MFVAGDIGGTKALLALYEAQAPRIARACLGVAGPVSGARADLTHRAWRIDARDLGIPAVRLINDFEASAHGLAALGADDLETLQAGACPVHVVTNERLGLIGAAAAAPQ